MNLNKVYYFEFPRTHTLFRNFARDRVISIRAHGGGPLRIPGEQPWLMTDGG